MVFDYSISEMFEKDSDMRDALDAFVKSVDEGIILADKESLRVKYANKKAMEMLSVDRPDFSIEELFYSDELQELREKTFIEKKINSYDAVISHIWSNESLSMIFVRDYSYANNIKNDLENITMIDSQLRKYLMKYDQSSLVITDSRGIIQFVGQETVDNCGHDVEFYIGKSVYEMEKQKIFYPSVTVKVLEDGKQHVMIQKTSKAEKLLVVIGTPVFNEKGELDKVISITKDYTEQVDLGAMLVKMENSMDLIDRNEKGFENIVTCSDSMFEIESLINLVAPTMSTILIEGETGSGKEVIARAVHEISDRCQMPFIAVNCGSLSPSLIESELFGYEKGAFTGALKDGKTGLIEAADGGTLFLDEIGELPLEQQVKILRVLQDRKIIKVGGTREKIVDIRVIAATNKKLEEEVRKGNFREDLYYRLNVVHIEIPPLRERKADIPLLTKHFVDFFNKKYNTQKRFSKVASGLMTEYNWPGNIRELENTIEGVIVSTKGNTIEAEDLPSKLKGTAAGSEELVHVKKIATFNEVIESAEIQLLCMAVEKYKTTTKIAEALGVNQSTISRKLSFYNIR